MLDIRLAPPQRLEQLTVFPLVSPGAADADCILLTDALVAGTLRITEVGGGTVPRLLAINTGALKVLILDGEHLIGARQNRTTSRSILLPARSETEIPVSCMEHGRWRFESREFRPSKHQSPARVRRRSRDLEARYVAEGQAPSDAHLAMSQGEVWEDIAMMSDKLGAFSPTGALDEVYSSRDANLEQWARAFPAIEGQVGLLVLARGRPVGLDVLGAPSLYARLHGRLLSGYLMDGLDADALGLARPSALGHRRTPSDAGPQAVDHETAQAFMDNVMQAERVPAPTVGLGTYRVLAERVVGGELVEAERLGHLSAFPAR